MGYYNNNIGYVNNVMFDPEGGVQVRPIRCHIWGKNRKLSHHRSKFWFRLDRGRFLFGMYGLDVPELKQAL
jgi:hypothetical protein